MSVLHGSWTERVRDYLGPVLAGGQPAPDRQPYYVGSWLYVFGVVTIAALVWGDPERHGPLPARPPVVARYRVGRFFNGLHFLSVQLFVCLHGPAPVGVVLRRGLA